MRCIAESVSEVEKRPFRLAVSDKTRDITCKNCGRKGHHYKECRGDLTCFFCKAKGHRRYDCPKLKDRARMQTQLPAQPMMMAAPVSSGESSSEVVATVAVPEGRILALS
ncbi:hypothetical protein P5V15_005892 [Pogonomyrmex californicus]